MDSKSKLILISILSLAAILRLAFIDFSPPSLNWDEVALGYNAYSLLRTTKDEWGNQIPLLLRSFDDYKPALYSYLSIPTIYFLGLNEISIRLLSAISGILIVLFGYKLSNYFFGRRTALFSALVIATSPWALIFSRAAYEANLALCIYLAAIYYFLRSKKYGRHLGVILLSLSMYGYHSYKILAPITLIVLVSQISNLRGKMRSIFTFILVSLPLLIIHIVNSESLSRLGSTSLYKVTIKNGQFSIPNYSLQLYYRYLSQYSPVNLFVRGGPEPTQHISGFGMFINILFVFWILGIIYILKNRGKQKLFILLTLIAPIPTIITWNFFYPARILPLLVFFSIIIGVGLSKTKNIIIATSLVLYLFVFSNLCTTLFLHDSYTNRGAWQYGMKQVMQAVNKYDDNYQTIVIETKTAQPHIFLLFYSEYDPAQYHHDLLSADTGKPRQYFDFNKYKFKEVYWFRQDEYLSNTLLVGPESSLPEEKINQNPNVELYEKITDPEGNTIAHLVGLGTNPPEKFVNN